MTTQHYPDIERAANTILGQQRATHPILRSYVSVVAADPNETRTLREFAAEPLSDAVQWELTHSRFVSGPDLTQRILDREAQPYRTNHYSVYFNREMDAAILLLAENIALFRAAGRPDGDVERGRAMRVVTSLAAKLAEFCQQQQWAWSNEVWRARNDEPLGEELPEP